MADIIYAQPQGQGSSWLKDLIPVAILGALALGGLWLLSKSGLLSGEGSSTSLDTGDSGPAGPGTSPSTGIPTSDLSLHRWTVCSAKVRGVKMLQLRA